MNTWSPYVVDLWRTSKPVLPVDPVGTLPPALTRHRPQKSQQAQAEVHLPFAGRAQAGGMHIALAILFGIAGYFMWATSFVDSTGAAIPGLGP